MMKAAMAVVEAVPTDRNSCIMRQVRVSTDTGTRT